MAVYTRLTSDEIQEFLSQYTVGQLVSADGIAEGISNSNYLLVVEENGAQKRYILTIFEQRANPAELPFFMALTEFLANQEIPCPRPVKSNDGGSLNIIKGKPAALIEFLEGKNNPSITPEHLQLVGNMVGRMHKASSMFTLNRRNTMGLDAWRWLFDQFRSRANEITPGLEKEIADELDFLARNWPRGLPGGVIHADLFPDNVFFSNEPQLRVSGVIDFYFACTDYWVYDLVICMNAWCFDAMHRFMPERSQALWQGYGGLRALLAKETAALPILARGAAMRFLMTRCFDLFNQPEGAMVTAKDPMEYVAKLRFHQQITDYRQYGLDA